MPSPRNQDLLGNAPVFAADNRRLRELIESMSTLNTEPGWPRALNVCEFARYKAILTALYVLAGHAPMIDLGCGEAHVTKSFEGVLVDCVVRPNEKKPVAKMDIREAPNFFRSRRFNLMIMTDVIEHLTSEEGLALLSGMEAICGARVIFTPVGPFLQGEDKTDPDTHKSAWYPEQFWRAGWTVWEFPSFHRFESGQILGAFWAWKFRDQETPDVETVAKLAGVKL